MSTVAPHTRRRDTRRAGGAGRGPAVTVPAVLLGCAVWQLWSVTVVQLARVGFDHSVAQRFWLAAVPGLTAGTLRLVRAVAGPAQDGRRWTAVGTAVLVCPLLWLAFAVRDPSTPYPVLLTIAALCGIGGAGLAAPAPGAACARTDGAGALGIGLVQLLAPIVVTAAVLGPLAGAPQHQRDGGELWLQNAALVWIPPLLLTAALIWFRPRGAARPAEQRTAPPPPPPPPPPPRERRQLNLRSKHGWLLAGLRLGTFGSFAGLAAAVPNLIDTAFTPIAPAWSATRYAWIGPVVGAAAGWLGGRPNVAASGARCTLVSFAGMALSVIVADRALPADGDHGNFWLCCAGFLGAFLFAGLGSGSTLRQFRALGRDRPRELTGASADLATAIAAYGCFLVPALFALAPPADTLNALAGYDGLCLLACWWYYAREGAEAPG